MPFIGVKKPSLGWKRGGRKEKKEGDKLKVRPNDLFNMECIGVSSPTLVLTKRFMFDCLITELLYGANVSIFDWLKNKLDFFLFCSLFLIMAMKGNENLILP